MIHFLQGYIFSNAASGDANCTNLIVVHDGRSSFALDDTNLQVYNYMMYMMVTVVQQHMMQVFQFFMFYIMVDVVLRQIKHI